MVLPLLAALVFGMIDFGINLSNQISVRQGVREGARQAVVMAPDAESVAEIVSLTKERIGVDRSVTKVHVVAEAVDAVAPGERSSELTTCAMVPLTSVSGLYSVVLDGRYIRSKVTMRVEQELTWTSTATSGGDPAPAGEDWTWCRADG